MKDEQIMGLSKVTAFIAGLSTKGLLALSGSLCGFIGVIFGEITTSQWGTAGLAGVVASGFGAAFVVVPRIMAERRLSRVSYSEIREKEISSSLERVSAACEREKAFLNLQVAELGLAVTFERNLKHEAIAFATDAQNRNIILSEQLRKAGIKPLVEIVQVNYRELSGQVDKTLTEMRQKTVEAARDAVTTTTTTTATNGKD